MRAERRYPAEAKRPRRPEKGAAASACVVTSGPHQGCDGFGDRLATNPCRTGRPGGPGPFAPRASVMTRRILNVYGTG
jgi:hypothetical protein